MFQVWINNSLRLNLLISEFLIQFNFIIEEFKIHNEIKFLILNQH